MSSPPFRFPDLRTLATSLAVLRDDKPAAGPVTVLHREPNLYASTFPSEVVTCRLPDGRERRVLCKYAGGPGRSDHGHRGGVAYEAAVYRQVLQPLHAQAPHFYGAYRDKATQTTWLIVEYLDASVRVNKTAAPGAMGLAARWVGSFHNAAETRLARSARSLLKTYDAGYYLGWASRTSRFAGALHGRFPWLAAVCERFGEVVPLLLASPPTVIHGEYYSCNVLFRRGRIYPIDWETAAVAAGEIDLATLTEGWPAETVRHCEREYQRARWPGGPPADFEPRMAAARLYLVFRWLGDRPEWTADEADGWRLQPLCALGEYLGLPGRAARPGPPVTTVGQPSREAEW